MEQHTEKKNTNTTEQDEENHSEKIHDGYLENEKEEIIKQDYIIPIAIVIGAIIIALSGRYGSNAMMDTSNTQSRTINTQQTSTQAVPQQAQQRQQIAPQGGGGCGV